MPVVHLCHCGHTKPCPTHHRHRNGRTTKSWQRTRQAVLERDRYTCQHCGAKASHAHRNDRDYHTNDPTAYTSLCLPCHTKAHNHAA